MCVNGSKVCEDTMHVCVYVCVFVCVRGRFVFTQETPQSL